MNALCQMTGLSRASYYRWGAPRPSFPVEMELRDAMQRDVAMSRTDSGLADAARTLETLTVLAEGESAEPADLELANLSTVATLITHAAWLRTESRGCHSRLDFPERDDAAWLGRTVLKRGAAPRFVPVHRAHECAAPADIPNHPEGSD